MAGVTMTHRPSVLSAGERLSSDKVWKKNRLVKKLINRSRPYAVNVLSMPMTAAIAAMRSSRALAAKSPLDLSACTFIPGIDGKGAIARPAPRVAEKGEGEGIDRDGTMDSARAGRSVPVIIS